MTTNSSLTIYHRQYNDDLDDYSYIRQNIDYVMWQGGIGASLNKGYDEANDITIYIPYSDNNLDNLKIDIGDIVVKGSIDTEITTQEDLKVDNVYNITTIIYNTYGSQSLHHIKLGGK